MAQVDPQIFHRVHSDRYLDSLNFQPRKVDVIEIDIFRVGGHPDRLIPTDEPD